ncbi:MAG: MoaD/ThiS family protein [Xanthomonadales bacterium]|nr:MoaD/ThiS family protein [Xanthomonadales bacterium]
MTTTVSVRLFGAFRDLAPGALVELPVPRDASIATLRAALDTHGRSHWPAFKPGLLAVSVFASAERVLREHEPVPRDGELAVLPPVSGG